MASSAAGLDLLSVDELRQLLGDEALVNKVLSAAAAKVGAPGRANHAGVPSNMPPDNPSRRVDILDIEDIANKVGSLAGAARDTTHRIASYQRILQRHSSMLNKQHLSRPVASASCMAQR